MRCHLIGFMPIRKRLYFQKPIQNFVNGWGVGVEKNVNLAVVGFGSTVLK